MLKKTLTFELSSNKVSGNFEKKEIILPLLLFVCLTNNYDTVWSYIMNLVIRKISLMAYANNTCADQPARPRSLISAFIVRYLDSVLPTPATYENFKTIASL